MANNQTGLTSEERKRASRLYLRITHPDYDRLFVEFLKTKIVVDANDCWLWQGFTQWTGYGSVGYRRKNWPVHRAMWAALNGGAIPEGMHVCHTCDVRRCCNPDHLWLGTNQQNITDMVAKGRGPCGEKAKSPTCKYGHPLSGANLYIHGGGKWRACKTCQRNRQATQHYLKTNAAAQRRRRAAKRAARQEQRA